MVWTPEPRRAGNSRLWDAALAVKIGVGLALTVVVPQVIAVVEIATRRWPTGGTR